MSSSDDASAAGSDSAAAASRETRKMIVEGPPGVQIQIIDGGYTVRARGTEKLQATLPQGVYIIRWVAADQTFEKTVRLSPLKKTLRVAAPPSVAPDRLVRDAGPADWSEQSLRELLPSQAPRGSEIVVMASAPTGALEGAQIAASLRSLRIYNHDDVAMRSDAGAVELTRLASSPGAESVLRAYHVTPGDYRMRYDASNGETLDQTILALPKRRTIVILHEALARTLVTDGDASRVVTFRGVDPARTVIVSTPTKTIARPDATTILLAETLLAALAYGGDPLDRPTLGRLWSARCDPFLRLYAAVLILARLEREESPALDDPYPRASEARDADAFLEARDSFQDRWRRRAERLLDLVDEDIPDDTADLVATRWRLNAPEEARSRILATIREGFRKADDLASKWDLGNVRQTLNDALRWFDHEVSTVETIPGRVVRTAAQFTGAPPARLTAPPMLRAPWRWVAKHSHLHADDLANSPSLRAAARGGVEASPWLAWRAAAAKQVVVASEETEAADDALAHADASEEIGRQVARLNAALRRLNLPEAGWSLGRARTPAEGRLEQLSPDGREVLQAAMRIGIAGAEEVAAPDVSDLAGELLAPAQSLELRVKRAADELEGIAGEIEGPGPPPSPSIETPDDAGVDFASDDSSVRFTRSVLDPDDPNKARFGGQPSVGGFTLAARFDETTRDGLIAATLSVLADDSVTLEDGDCAEFFLPQHPRLSVEFVDRRAELRVRIFGGFTVGVWLPRQEVSLELDLAELEHTPWVAKAW